MCGIGFSAQVDTSASDADKLIENILAAMSDGLGVTPMVRERREMSRVHSTI
jgi:hypothetical protein